MPATDKQSTTLSLRRSLVASFRHLAFADKATSPPASSETRVEQMRGRGRRRDLPKSSNGVTDETTPASRVVITLSTSEALPERDTYPRAQFALGSVCCARAARGRCATLCTMLSMLTPYVITIFGSTGWAQLFLGLVLLCLTTNALKKDASDGSAATKNAAAVPKDFPTFQRQYLAVMGIVMLADWLQGPYIYDLYMESLSEAQYSSLFLSGFLSSAVFGTPVGVLVDTIGRKRGCVLYCVLEIVINLLEHATTFELLLLGRFLGGISTSLLGCAFESCDGLEAQGEGLSAHLLDETFTIVSAATASSPSLAASSDVLQASRHGSDWSVPSGGCAVRCGDAARVELGRELRRGGAGVRGCTRRNQPQQERR